MSYAQEKYRHGQRRRTVKHQVRPVEKRSGYAPINGLDMYYESQGNGKPLLYLGMGFGVAGITEFPGLTKRWELVTMDLQGRGRTADIDRPLSFEQQAEDVVGLMDFLQIGKADFLGECVGGVVAMIIAIRYPERVNRLFTYGAIFGRPQEAYKEDILAGVMSLTSDGPVLEFQRTNYRRVAPDPDYFPRLFSKFNSLQWNGFSREELESVRVPVLIAVGDHDWVRLDHVSEAFALIPDAQLLVIPDAGHFVLDSEQHKVIGQIESFLDGSRDNRPFATTAIAYQRGLTR